MPRFNIESENERTARDSYGAIKKIAAKRNLTFEEATEQVPEAKAILMMVDEMTELLAEARSAEPVEKAAPPDLAAAAVEIARDEGISTERAFGRISKRYPALAERYRAET